MSVISPSTPFGHVTFFDDIRQELNGKFIFTGVYTGNLVIPTAPVWLPSFVVMVTYRERPGESTDQVTVKIFMPGESEANIALPMPVDQMRQAVYDPTVDFEGMDKILSMSVPLVFSPFAIAQEGFIRVRAYRGDDEIRLGALRVQVGSVPGLPFQQTPPPTNG